MTFTRVRRPIDIGPIIQLIAHSPKGELGHDALDFVDWAGKEIHRPGVCVVLARVGEQPAGYAVAFAPWELEKCAFVSQSYIAPEFRNQGILQAGIKVLWEWAVTMGAKRLAFETDRARAWKRLLGADIDTKQRLEVEV